MNHWDVDLFYRVNHLAGTWPAVDRLMVFFAADAIYLYALLLVIAWFALPRRDGAARHALVTSALAALFGLAVNFVTGHYWFRPRPFAVLPAGSFRQLIPHAPDASFPSDHATASFALASGAWGRTPRWISVLFTLMAVVIMVARVWVGVHWPTDVLGGLVVGVLSGRILAWASPLFRPLTNLGLRLFRYGNYAPQWRRSYR